MHTFFLLKGLCRAIGVSNYDIADLEKLMDTASITPHVNQVEFHPFQNPIELRKFCKENNIQIEVMNLNISLSFNSQSPYKECQIIVEEFIYIF